MPEYYDDFDRPDALTLGADWDFGTNDWEIDAGWAKPVNDNVPPSAIPYQTVAFYRYRAHDHRQIVEAYVKTDIGMERGVGIIAANQSSSSGSGNYGAIFWGATQGIGLVHSLAGIPGALAEVHVAEPNMEGILRLEVDHPNVRVHWLGILRIEYISPFNPPWITGSYAGIWARDRGSIDWWRLSWAARSPDAEGKSVYEVADGNGEIHACVVNDVSAIPGMSEDADGIIHVEAPRTATDLGDGVLLIE